MIYKYTDIDINEIRFSDISYNKLKCISMGDEKLEKNIYYIDMYYNNDSLYIQLPKNKLYMINYDNKIVKIIIDEKMNDNFIKKLEEYIIKVVHKNSELWFNGKKFTMNKIVNCIIRNVNYVKENIIMTLTLDNECKFFNQYGIFLNKRDLQFSEGELLDKNIDIVCVIKIDNLQFIDNKFTYNIVLEQAKIYNNKKITEYSILDDISDESKVTVSDDLDDEYYKKTD